MKKKLFVILAICSATLSAGYGVSADTPYNGYHFDNRFVTFNNDGSNTTYKNFWYVGASRWTNNSDVTLLAGYNDNFRAGNINESTATWDGICYTNYNWLTRIVTSTRTWLNEKYTTQSQYTTEIINGIATHEFGHAFGLAHNDTEASVMLSYTFNSNSTLARIYDSPTPSDTHTISDIYDGIPHGSAAKLSILEGIENPNNKENVLVIEPSWAVKYNTIEDLANSADLIIKAVPKNQKEIKVKATNKLNEYSTVTSIEVKEVLKGDEDLSEKSIKLQQIGGEDETTLYYSPHTTYLRENEEAIIFLKKISENTYIPINEDDSIFIKIDNGISVNKSPNQYKHLHDNSVLTENELINKIKKQ